MVERFDTVVIGAGQAGLSVGYYLNQHHRDYVILERDRIGESWRSAKWDSFTLVTPNWTLRLPNFAYVGDNPDGFLSRDEVIQYLEDYATSFNPLVRTGIEVNCVRGEHESRGFIIETNRITFAAANVVVAVGLFQKPKIPMFSSRLASHLYQVHSSQYRNPQQLPSGVVLVVGAGQSGCQIADDLRQAGHKVYLCTGWANRLPRSYRGKDIFWWAEQMGILNQPVNKLPSLAARFVANPQLASANGERMLSLHRLALDGVTLLGRLQDADGTKIFIGEDLMEHVAQADKFDAEFKQAIDEFIAQTGLDAPPDNEPILQAGYRAEPITELDLEKGGIASIIWSGGYTFDFSWIQFPIFDEFGYPVQERGVTAQPGLYFVGLHWLSVLKSGLFAGVGEDAAYVVEHIAGS